MVIKSSLPNESLTDNNLTAEANYLKTLYDTKPRSNSGQASYTSTTSGVVYTTVGSVYDSQGQEGLLQILQIALKNYGFSATDYNEIVDAIADVNTRVDETNTITNTHVANNEIHITQTERTNWDSLQEQVSRNSYDDYQLWLELYYKGYISQVEAINAKAIVFDGFMDTDNVDTVNSTVTIDTVNKKVMLKDVDILLKSGDSQFGLWGNHRLAQVFTVKGTSKLKSIVIPMNNTVSATVKLRIVNTDTYGVPMMASIVYNDVYFSVNSTTNSYVVELSDLTLTQGVKYAVVFSTTYGTQDSVRFYYGGTYDEGSSYVSSDSGDTWGNINSSMRLDFIFDYISPSTLITDQKNIPFIPTSFKLYQSIKKPVGATITTTLSADGGINYETPVLTISRADPKFTGYTEEEYELIITNVGQEIILKSVLTGSNRDEVEIKRYGLIIS